MVYEEFIVSIAMAKACSQLMSEALAPLWILRLDSQTSSEAPYWQQFVTVAL